MDVDSVPGDVELLTANGWHVIDPIQISIDPWRYRDYLRGSRAEFTIAKDMKDNKEATIKSVARTMKVSEKVIAAAYDIELGMMSFDGTFDEQALKLIQSSLKELGIVEVEPKIEDMYAKGFVPVVLQ